ncbi:uncharacterized protein [Diabrotica undecimpunctata]|uniref:uncharacterized protein n=1 Tax=Diabrotica undecimpunctata TaxID=50387 RepID=UPI003B63924D
MHITSLYLRVKIVALSRKSAKKIETTQKTMERNKLGISLTDIRYTEIRLRTKIRDILEWRSTGTKRSIRKPQKRLVVVTGKQWIRFAQDKERWKQLGETYIQE